jgi:hypothetical protein
MSRVRKTIASGAICALGVLGIPASYASAATKTSLRPLNSGPHTNQNVTISAYSYDADDNETDGPDITTVEVYTANGVDLPIGSVIYLEYGPTPAQAKTRIPLAVRPVDVLDVNGYNFPVYRTLNVGWVLCGSISTTPGYPCITIGADDDGN